MQTKNKPSETEKKAIDMIAQAAEMLGWQIAFDGTADPVRYIIVGEPESLDQIVAVLED